MGIQVACRRKKGGSVVCINEVRINILTNFILSIRFYDIITQHAKKVVSDSPGLVDFATGLVNSVLNLSERQVKFFVEFIHLYYRRTVINPVHQKKNFQASLSDSWTSTF